VRVTCMGRNYHTPGSRPATMRGMSDPANDDLRNRAIHRLRAKQGFWYALAAWVVFSVFFVIIWAVTGGGYFWPGWPIGAWAVALIFTAFRAFGPAAGGPSESQIQSEMDRLK
jgi:hypothetical protein